MKKTQHLNPGTESVRMSVEKRYRREGYIVALVTLVGFLVSACCMPISSFVGFVLNTNIHPATFVTLGGFIAAYGLVMCGAHCLRTTEDVAREMGNLPDSREGLYGIRAWYQS